MATEQEIKLELLKCWLDTGVAPHFGKRQQWQEELRRLEGGEYQYLPETQAALKRLEAAFGTAESVTGQEFTAAELEQALKDFEKF